MITLKSPADIEKMYKAGQVVAETLRQLGEAVRPGVTTEELNDLADRVIRSYGAYPSSLHFEGYPKSICVSVNEEVVHGIPSKRKLREGDIVSCDVVAKLNGFHGDATRTFFVGAVDPEVRLLVERTEACFFEALKYCRVGYRLSDVSTAIQRKAESYGYGVVRELTGHGIGREMHEDPEVPNYYSPRARTRLQQGMTIAIEPMINMGTAQVWQLDDGWTVVTRDRKPSAHYENTVAITDGDPIVLTILEAQDGKDGV